MLHVAYTVYIYIYIYIYIDFQNKYLTEIKIHLLEEQNYDNLSLEQKWGFFS